jgi:hypothetical protein
MTLSEGDLRKLTDQALDGFWEVIANRFPQATSGDLAPWPTIQLQIAAENAVQEWIGNNVPTATSGRKRS